MWINSVIVGVFIWCTCKNHTNHNQNKKAHKNGIKKPKTYKYPSLKGVDAKFRRNHRYALHGTAKALAKARAEN
ncbi:60S ribosomal protein L29 [Candida parapsilosis]|nr:60S ribosomal protein L29 [Candida parapsilosis]KAI5908223.1 60S ribosomal protein L29 [Candida parapsilosis]